MVSNSSLQFEDGAVIKFLCSYGGKILPRQTDGKLRYFGGDTRVLAVDRSITFAELSVKLGELCGTSSSVSLRCQLPMEDLDALVSITCDEDLANIIEEYDRANKRAVSPFKIRAFLWPPKSTTKQISPPPSITSPPQSVRSFTTSPAVRFIRITSGNVSGRYVNQMSKPLKCPVYGSRLGPYAYLPQRNPLRNTYRGNHWQ